MFWYLIITIITLIFYIFVFKRQKTWIKRNVKQASTTPFFGDIQIFRKRSIAELIKDLYDFSPEERYLGVHQMTIPILMLRDPDLIKQLTVKDFDHFTDHRSLAIADPLWNKNLLSLKGDDWRDMRSALSPAFTGSKMRAMFCLINECANQFKNHFLDKNEDKIELEMKDAFTRYANDVIATCAFGVTVDSLKEPENEFYLRGKEATNSRGMIRNIKLLLSSLSPSLAKVLNFKMFSEQVGLFFQKLISDSIKVRESKNIVRPDIIHLLMEARKGKLKHDKGAEVNDAGFATVQESHIGKVERVKPRELSDLDITAHALIFFFGGFDTVSAAMSFFAYELALNPDVQEKLILEVDATLNECSGDITYESLVKMKYMDMVTSELLRKWPTFSVMDRVCVKPYTVQPTKAGEKPFPIKVGEMLWLPIMGLHRDPKYYENPETFNPERFSDENKHKINPYAYIPFGSGPRNCIASRFAMMEIKIVIFQVLSKFKFVPTKKTSIPIKLDKALFNLGSEDGFWLALQKR